MALKYKTSRVTIGQIVKRGRNIILQNFVPNNLGYRNCTRELLKNHTTDLARLLYCNDPEKCVIICDGTYVYCNSSSNYSHQRHTYSGQKRRHLFKIMKFITVDGFIIDIFGPFRANQNDAEILKVIFEKTSFKNILKAGDVVLVDRGFRDCMTTFQSLGLDAKIPAFIQKGTNGQLTTDQCNKSRLITKLRFAIELANGRMKMKWGLFNKIIPSILSTYLMSDYKIGAAILNAFGKPITCDKEDSSLIGTEMLKHVNLKNDLSRIIITKKFQQSRNFLQSISPGQLFFPKFNLKELKHFSLGNYAIKQAISYTADVKRKNGTFPIFMFPPVHVQCHFGKICVENNFTKPIFIYTRIDSRFRGNKFHDVYLLYDKINKNHDFLFYCTCQRGRRTMGCCSHVMTVVWYFSYGRHKSHLSPASHLDSFFDIDLN